MISLVHQQTKCRVSSVLNRDPANYGKAHLFDGSEETCWSSDQGTPQSITVDFEAFVTVQKIDFQFQGGFVAKECKLIDPDHSDTSPETLYPEDSSQVQIS